MAFRPLAVCLHSLRPAARAAAGCLAIGLSLPGCSSSSPETAAATKSAVADWPAATPADGVAAKIAAPATVSADAALIAVTAAVTNTGTASVLLRIPTPCDRNDWRLLDAAGTPVMRKHPVTCVQQSVTMGLAAGETFSEPVTIELAPGVLESGRKYTLEDRFWGQPAVATFNTSR